MVVPWSPRLGLWPFPRASIVAKTNCLVQIIDASALSRLDFGYSKVSKASGWWVYHNLPRDYIGYMGYSWIFQYISENIWDINGYYTIFMIFHVRQWGNTMIAWCDTGRCCICL